MTIKELQESKSHKKLHTSLTRGYTSRKTNGYIKEYNGRFGKGFAHIQPYWESNNYSLITYYVEN